MSRIAGSSADIAYHDFRRRNVPVLSTVVAILVALAPIVVSTPIIPDIAFLVLLSWRLLRPEIWTPLIALPLGFANDLVAGHPIGQSMALWTLIFVALDLLDTQRIWRDYWIDWLIAALAIVAYTAGSWLITGLMGSAVDFAVLLPQVGLAILLYPLVSRLVLSLDRWRLSR